MSTALEILEDMVGARLARESRPTRARIRELIDAVRATPLCIEVTAAEAEELALEFEFRHGVTMTVGSVITDKRYEPWLSGARPGITPYYWDRYRKLLAAKHLSGQVLATLDEVTERILGLLEDPSKEGPWDRRGMVVGHVQSGKTANYTGLCCKAADAGYRLIVVIAGIHNNLRNQTQRRIDEGLVGRNSARLLSNKDKAPIGVGLFNSSRVPNTFTNSVKDFSKDMANGVGIPLQNLKEPAVFVIKKNSNTLKNLLEWLAEHNARHGTSRVDAPMLLIDDEADNASINTKHGSAEVSRINGQIRDLLAMFERSCYVGYTATPFANIFIDPDSAHEMHQEDLFPKHFIVSLDPPSNYFGPDRVFRLDPETFIRPIEDNEEILPLRHPKDTQVHSLPESLCAAIRTFLIGRAIRIARGQRGEHCSMLINASRFTDVQRQLRNEVHEMVERIKASVRVNSGLAAPKALLDDEISSLYHVWEKEFSKGGEFAWGSIQENLNEAVSQVVVVEVNSRSSGNLNYGDYEKTGLNVIAVGGYALSRGLTLEGLMVSYFLRNSIMYDTLMQMGRWFGYRPGYEDLCRVWMPEAAQGWYAHIAESIEELREELRNMEAANATPEQFGLKVRSHPDTLIVTARNKMGSGEKLRVSIGLSKRFIETAILRWDPESLQINRRAAVGLAERIRADGLSFSTEQETRGGFLVSDVPATIVDSFLRDFQNHRGSMVTESDPLRRYIQERADGELQKWDVLFSSLKEEGVEGLVNGSLGVPLNCPRRAPGKKSVRGVTLYVTNKQRVASRGVEQTGLTAQQIEEAERHYRSTLPEDKASKLNYPDRIYRSVRSRPLIIVHLLAIGDKKNDLRSLEPTVAWSISFPATATKEQLIEYVVNPTWLRENYREELEDLEEEEMAGDDD